LVELLLDCESTTRCKRRKAKNKLKLQWDGNRQPTSFALGVPMFTTPRAGSLGDLMSAGAYGRPSIRPSIRFAQPYDDVPMIREQVRS